MASEAERFILIDDKRSAVTALAEIKSQDLLALDCEGVKLGRSGKLTVLIMATRSKVFIFDISKLGKDVFDEGLRDILENDNKEKLMFDCRQDSDILWHQYKVKLEGILDLQLLEIMYRREHSDSSSRATPWTHRRSTRTDDVENVHGYLRCLELYCEDKDLIVKKEKGKSALQDDSHIWERRPISDILVDYCCVDVSGLFKLFEKLKGRGNETSRLRVASRRYTGVYRDLFERSYDDYEGHAYLPLDIIPEKGSLDFPVARTKCVGCKRLFPREEFSHIQLRNGVQKCRVCKKIKQRTDVQQNREDNWARDEDCEVYDVEVWGDNDIYF